MMNSRKGTLPLLKELHKTGRRGPQMPVSVLKIGPYLKFFPRSFFEKNH